MLTIQSQFSDFPKNVSDFSTIHHSFTNVSGPVDVKKFPQQNTATTMLRSAQ